MEFGADANIILEEVEVEGLGLGLEPLEDEPSETLPVTSETGSEEISLEISEAPALEINDLSAISLEEKADIEHAKEEETPKAPVLDLGEDEISLELDEDPEPERPPTPPVQIDELDLNLEIDEL